MFSLRNTPIFIVQAFSFFLNLNYFVLLITEGANHSRRAV
jgi:hypothetical protein